MNIMYIINKIILSTKSKSTWYKFDKIFSIIVAAGLVAWLTAISLYKWGPLWQHDYPSYHLPFILRDLNLSTWQLWPHLLLIWEGYPPLAHLFQGVLIFISNYPPLANSINFFTIVIFISLMGYLNFKRNLSWALLGYFSLPLYLLNFPIGQIDIWVGSFIVIQFFSLVRVIEFKEGFRFHAIFILSTFIAMLSKMNAWAIAPYLALIYSGIQLYYLFIKYNQIMLFRIVLVAIAVLFWPVRNLILFDNPTWPIPLPPLFNSGSFSIHPEVFPAYFIGTPRPLLYIISFFELSRFATDQPLIWNFTMWQGGSTSPNQMMGGLNGLYMLFLSTFLVYLAVKKMIPNYILWILGSSILIVSFTVQSYEMRYSLYIPMIIISIAALYSIGNSQIIYKLGCILFLYFVVSKLNNDTPHLFSFENNLLDNHTSIREFWDRNKDSQNTDNSLNYACIPNTEQNWTLADPLGIYFTGPSLNDFKVKLCRSECSKPWQACGFEW